MATSQDRSACRPRFLTKAFYEVRLGLVAASGKQTPLGRQVESALATYESVFMPGPPYPMRWLFMEKETREGSGDSGSLSVQWEPGPLGAAKPNWTPQRLSRRLLLGNLWRGGVAREVGTDGAEILLGSSWVLRRVALQSYARGKKRNERLSLLLLGDRSGDLGSPAAWQVVPQTEHWMWIGTGTGGIGHLVIDIDCKADKAEPVMRAAMDLLTKQIRSPKPFLITTSKGGRGRHLFYATKGTTGEVTGSRTRFSAPLRGAVEQRYGFRFTDGVIEAFPKGESPLALMPPLPFGPNSHLCDQYGNVIERDPIKGLLRWHRGLSGPIVGIAEDEFVSPDFTPIRRRDIEIVRAAIDARRAPGHQRSQPRVRSTPAVDAVKEPVTKMRHVGAKPATSANPASQVSRYDIAWAEGLLDDGIQRGSVNEDLPGLVRYLKFNVGMEEGAATDKLLQVLSPIIDKGHPASEYRRRIKSLWDTAKHPLASGKFLGFALTPTDAAWVCGRVVEFSATWKRQRRPRMKALAQFWLAIVGLARSQNPAVAGWCRELPLASTMMERWTHNYAWLKRRIEEGKALRAGRAPSETHHRAGRYAVLLPAPKGALAKIESARECWTYAVHAISDDLGHALIGKRNWKRAKGQLTDQSGE